MSKAVTIYGVLDPYTCEVVYVGKANDYKKRLRTHISDSRRRNTPFCAWLRKRMSEGVVPALVPLASALPGAWADVERAVIAQHRAEGLARLNVAAGGDQPLTTKASAVSGARRLNELIRSRGAKYSERLMLKRRFASYMNEQQRVLAGGERRKSFMLPLAEMRTAYARLSMKAERLAYLHPNEYGNWVGRWATFDEAAAVLGPAEAFAILFPNVSQELQAHL